MMITPSKNSAFSVIKRIPQEQKITFQNEEFFPVQRSISSLSHKNRDIKMDFDLLDYDAEEEEEKKHPKEHITAMEDIECHDLSEDSSMKDTEMFDWKKSKTMQAAAINSSLEGNKTYKKSNTVNDKSSRSSTAKNRSGTSTPYTTDDIDSEHIDHEKNATNLNEVIDEFLLRPGEPKIKKSIKVSNTTSVKKFAFRRRATVDVDKLLDEDNKSPQKPVIKKEKKDILRQKRKPQTILEVLLDELVEGDSDKSGPETQELNEQLSKCPLNNNADDWLTLLDRDLKRSKTDPMPHKQGGPHHNK